MRANAVSFRTIDATDEDFSDLQPLKKLIGDARIVQLGEQSHGDGASFQTKIRLIKFLHQEMGFDVLAFESGMYDCRKAWQAIQAGEDGQSAAELGVFGIWTGSSQTSELWSYLSQQANEKVPLELCGFDCQFTGGASSQSLQDDLHELFEKLKLEIDPDALSEFDSQLARIIRGEKPDSPVESVADILKRAIDALATESSSELESTEVPYWQQQMISIQDHCLRQWKDQAAMGNVMGRDKQMAENLVWLANNTYKDRKVIVWAASFHIIRDPSKIDVPDNSVNYKDVVPMGQYVDQALGQAVFTIGFTANRGKAGAWFRQGFDIGESPAGTFESICDAAGLENGLVVFRELNDSGKWLNEPVYSRPLGYTWMKAVWPRHFDAMIFNKVMTPSTGR